MVDCQPSGTSTASEWRQRLSPSVALAWRAFDRASALSSRVTPSFCVTPAAPILFFGDLDAYLTSPLRVLTVALNPSLHEFPNDKPFLRFPLAGDSGDREPGHYLDAMSAYFRTEPYSSWFGAFERVLNGVGTSYYAGEAASTALHTDICSPVATNPTWRTLGPTAQSALVKDGGPLWHMFLKVLRPQIVVLSVARKHLMRVEFGPISKCEKVHVFERTRDGTRRQPPYEVLARWYKVGGECSLFVFGQAAQTPFGLLSHDQKYETGTIALEKYRDGR